jgi:hypothetical protein
MVIDGDALMSDLRKFVDSMFGWTGFPILALTIFIGCSAATTKTELDVDFEGIRETDQGFEAIAAGGTATDPTLTLRRRIELWDKDFARQVIEKIVEFTGLKVKTS